MPRSAAKSAIYSASFPIGMDAQKIFEQIDKRLANDNATGRIFVEREESAAPAELLTFPGRDRPKAQSYGPFAQEGNLDGLLIAVGGKDETVPLRLQNGETTYSNCDTTRAIARDLGKHLFEPVRILRRRRPQGPLPFAVLAFP